MGAFGGRCASCGVFRRVARWLGADRRYEYLLVWGLCLLVLVAAMVRIGIYPFGDTAFVRADGLWQYVGYAGWASEVMHGEASPFYSFAKSLGGGTFSLFQGMAASPTTLLLAFFEPADVPKFFSLLMVIKLPLCGVTCHLFLRRRFGFRGFPYVLLSCSYGLMMCLFTTGSNVMWLDNIVALPLFALGVHRLVREGKALLLFAVAALCIIDNWYCAYMACLFSAMCFFLEVSFAPQRGWRLFWRAGVRFAATMLLAVGASMAVFYPVIKAMTGSAAVTTNAAMAEVSWSSFEYGLHDLVRNYYLGNASVSAPDFGNFPISGFALLLGMSLFFVPGHGKLKAAAAAVLALFVASYVYQPLGLVWSGFVRADSYVPRFIYLWQFSLVVAAALAFSLLQHETRARRAVALGVPGALFAAALVYEHLRIPFNSTVILVLQVGALIAFAVLLCLLPGEGAARVRGHGGRRRARVSRAARIAVPCALALCFSVELGGALSRIMYVPYFDVTTMSVSAYESYMRDLGGRMAELEEQDASFYRTEKATFSSLGDSLTNEWAQADYMALGMRGLTHYSSYMQQSVNDLLGALGYCDTPGFRSVTVYNSPLLPADSLLGLKYLFVQHDSLPGCDKLEAADGLADGANLFKNRLALPLGYGVSGSAASVSWGEDVFDNQERWLGEMTGADESGLYIDAEVTEREAEPRSSGGGEADDDLDRFWVTAQADGPLYLYLSTDDGVRGGVRDRGALFVEGELIQSVSEHLFDTNAVYLGDYRAGDALRVGFAPSEGSELSLDQVYAATLDEERCAQRLSQLAEWPLEVGEFEDGRVKATFDARDGGQKLLLTIPVEDGWHVYVNGEEQQPESFNGLMLLSVEEGKNDIFLEYRVPGMGTGLAVTAVSVLLFAGWRAVARAKAKRK